MFIFKNEQSMGQKQPTLNLDISWQYWQSISIIFSTMCLKQQLNDTKFFHLFLFIFFSPKSLC